MLDTGGFQGDVRDGAYGVRCGLGDDALARFVAMLARLPQHAWPGEMWAYNNAGFCLAGRVIEVVTGQTFEDAIRTLVLEPLGMRCSASPRKRSRIAWRLGTRFGTAARKSCAGGRCRGCFILPVA